jgi:hypothetical protein
MKTFYKILFGLWLLSLPLCAQTYELRVLNQSASNGSFEFEIYILRLGDTPIYLGNCNFVLTFNQQNFDNPVAETVTEGLSGFYAISPSIPTAGQYYVSLGQPSFGNQTQFDAFVTNVSSTYPGSLVGRFRITNVSNLNSMAGLQWRNSGLNHTEVSTLQNTFPWTATAITNPNFHLNPEDTPLPIQLTSFTASVVRDNDVEVSWKTVSETNNYGFEVYRKRGEAGECTKVGFVEGHGTTLAPRSYTYVDKSVGFGKYSYQIRQVDLDGKSKAYPEVDITVGVVPGKLVLTQNYPNPFNPSTTIEFAVPQTGFATMKVYSVLGQEVASLFEGNAEAGKINTAQFNASNLPSGLYCYTLRSAGKADTKWMLLLK